MSDNRGDHFAAAGAAKVSWGPGYGSRVAFVRNLAGGITTVTSSFSKAVMFAKLYVQEYSGVRTSSRWRHLLRPSAPVLPSTAGR